MSCHVMSLSLSPSLSQSLSLKVSNDYETAQIRTHTGHLDPAYMSKHTHTHIHHHVSAFNHIMPLPSPMTCM
ncbi:hypothetical protein GGR50DRAFT_539468 [Xylaria sp. CBS 124048]|nr:hypothetical protein GGR50DRAFT_539468 [Xylaria sp. CBS 124048]